MAASSVKLYELPTEDMRLYHPYYHLFYIYEGLPILLHVIAHSRTNVQIELSPTLFRFITRYIPFKVESQDAFAALNAFDKGTALDWIMMFSDAAFQDLAGIHEKVVPFFSQMTAARLFKHCCEVQHAADLETFKHLIQKSFNQFEISEKRFRQFQLLKHNYPRLDLSFLKDASFSAGTDHPFDLCNLSK